MQWSQAVLSLDEIVARYCAGLFPMDQPGAPQLPWWAADPRAVLELEPWAMQARERAVRRSLRAADGSWMLRVDGAFDEVIERCGRRDQAPDEVWLSPRLAAVYARLHGAGLCHTFELWDERRWVAGIVGVTIGRVAMLESMIHRAPHAGNVCLVRTVELLADAGCELCDVQMSTPHTTRLGARLISRTDYERRLAAALGQP